MIPEPKHDEGVEIWKEWFRTLSSSEVEKYWDWYLYGPGRIDVGSRLITPTCPGDLTEDSKNQLAACAIIRKCMENFNNDWFD